MSLEGAKLICLDDAGNHGEIVMAKGRKFTLGYYVNCDYVLVDERAKGVHCEIECDAFGRVTIRNLSPDKPILVNGSTVEVKRFLLNNSKLSILDKEYLWSFPKTCSNEFENIAREDASTPQKQIGIPEQPPNSCPDFKLHRDLPKRFTVHNFAYCIQSDEEGNISSEVNDETTTKEILAREKETSPEENKNSEENNQNTIESREEEDTGQKRSITPEPKKENENVTSILLETPKMNLINCTNDKENKSTQKTNKQLLTMCHLSDVVITSFSPRETGVRIEKSFATIIEPRVLVTKPPKTPKSVYSTPKGELNEIGKDSSRNFINFHTPSTSQTGSVNAFSFSTASKVLKNSSMHLIDLTTPNKSRPASPYLKSALKAASIKKNPIQSVHSKLTSEAVVNVSELPSTPAINETPSSIISVSSVDTPSVIEVTSDASNMGITPLSGLTTPKHLLSKNTGVCTPKRTPQSLMKRALLTSAKKQTTTPQTNTATSRRDSLNRIPLRSALLRTPITPQNATADKSTSQLSRRLSMSTPTRKNAATRNLLDNSPSTSKTAIASSRSTTRRSSLNPISALRDVPTSTPMTDSSKNARLRTRAACKTSPLHKVRKSVSGIPLSSHISKSQRTLALPASTSKLTSLKDKSPQQIMSNRLVNRARKSLGISPITTRSRTNTPNARKTIEPRKPVLFGDRVDRGEEDNLSRTYIIDSDEDDNVRDKTENDKPKDATFSPVKDTTINLETTSIRECTTVSQREQQEAFEIPLDVEEVSNKSKNQNPSKEQNVIDEKDIVKKLDKDIVQADVFKDIPDDAIDKGKPLVAEESFAEIINLTPIEHSEKPIEIFNSPEESSQAESQESVAETINVEQHAVTTAEDSTESSFENNSKKPEEILESGFGEESMAVAKKSRKTENTGELAIREGNIESVSYGNEISDKDNIQAKSSFEKSFEIQNETVQSDDLIVESTIDVLELDNKNNIQNKAQPQENTIENENTNKSENNDKDKAENESTAHTESETLHDEPSVCDIKSVNNEILSETVEKTSDKENSHDAESFAENVTESKEGNIAFTEDKLIHKNDVKNSTPHQNVSETIGEPEALDTESCLNATVEDNKKDSMCETEDETVSETMNEFEIVETVYTESKEVVEDSEKSEALSMSMCKSTNASSECGLESPNNIIPEVIIENVEEDNTLQSEIVAVESTDNEITPDNTTVTNVSENECVSSPKSISESKICETESNKSEIMLEAVVEDKETTNASQIVPETDTEVSDEVRPCTIVDNKEEPIGSSQIAMEENNEKEDTKQIEPDATVETEIEEPTPQNNSKVCEIESSKTEPMAENNEKEDTQQTVPDITVENDIEEPKVCEVESSETEHMADNNVKEDTQQIGPDVTVENNPKVCKIESFETELTADALVEGGHKTIITQELTSNTKADSNDAAFLLIPQAMVEDIGKESSCQIVPSASQNVSAELIISERKTTEDEKIDSNEEESKDEQSVYEKDETEPETALTTDYKNEENQKTFEYKPIYEDITLEGSLIEKELVEEADNTESKQPIYEDITIEGSAIEANVENEVLENKNTNNDKTPASTPQDHLSIVQIGLEINERSNETVAVEVNVTETVDNFENTTKLLEEIEDVLNKSDEIKQKHLNELEVTQEEGGNNKPLTEEYENFTQETSLSSSSASAEKAEINKDLIVTESVDSPLSNAVAEASNGTESEANKIETKCPHSESKNLANESLNVDERETKETLTKQYSSIETEANEELIKPVMESKNSESDVKEANTEFRKEVPENEAVKQNIALEAIHINSNVNEVSNETKYGPNSAIQTKMDNTTCLTPKLRSTRRASQSTDIPQTSTEAMFTPRRSTRRASMSAETAIVSTPTRKSSRRASISAETNIVSTPTRKSTRRDSISAETTTVSTPTRKSTRRASISGETSIVSTPTRNTNRRASLSAINETTSVPQIITRRRASMSVEEEINKPAVTSKTPRAKTPQKQIKQKMIIPEDLNEVITSTILEEEDENVTAERVSLGEIIAKEVEEIKTEIIPIVEGGVSITEKLQQEEEPAEDVDTASEHLEEITSENIINKQEIQKQIENIESITQEFASPIEKLEIRTVKEALTNEYISNDEEIEETKIKEDSSNCPLEQVISSTTDNPSSDDTKEIQTQSPLALTESVDVSNAAAMQIDKLVASAAENSNALNEIQESHMNEDDQSSSIISVTTSEQELMKTPMATGNEDNDYALVENEKEISSSDTLKTPSTAGLSELLKPPKLDGMTPKVGDIRDLVCQNEESEKLPTAAQLLQTPTIRVIECEEKAETSSMRKNIENIDSSPSTPLLKGRRELLKTPKPVIYSPNLTGLRNLVQTPKEISENERKEIDKPTAITDFVNAPQTNCLDAEEVLDVSPTTSNKNFNLLEVKELPETSKICSTAHLKGMRELMQTSKLSSTPEMEDIKELMLDSSVEIENKPEDSIELDTTKNLEANTQEMSVPKTPKPTDTSSLKGMRELLKTPKICSTPLLTGVKELLDSSVQEKMENVSQISYVNQREQNIESVKNPEAKEIEENIASTSKNFIPRLSKPMGTEETPKITAGIKESHQEFDKFLKTPTAKNIMIPTMPSSAVIEKSADSIEEVSTEYDLNATNEDQTSHLEDIFKTPAGAHFTAHIRASYYDEERDAEELGNENISSTNKNETLEDCLNKSAEEAFDKLVGQENQIQTPVRNTYNRKSAFDLKTPQAQSPFTVADVLSDLPKTDVEEWIKTLGDAEPPLILECEDNESTEANLNDVFNLDQDELQTTDNECIIPETCTKVYLSETNAADTSTDVLIKDPLRTTPAKVKVKETFTSTSIEAEISGINLLDQTVESIQNESLLLVDDPSVFEEPLLVSDNESEPNDSSEFNKKEEADSTSQIVLELSEDNDTTNQFKLELSQESASDTLNNTHDGKIVNVPTAQSILEFLEEEDCNDLSEPLLLSDSEDLNYSQEQVQEKCTKMATPTNNDTNTEEYQHSINTESLQERSILQTGVSFNVTTNDDPLITKDSLEHVTSTIVIVDEDNVEEQANNTEHTSADDEIQVNLDSVEENRIEDNLSPINEDISSATTLEVKCDVLEKESIQEIGIHEDQKPTTLRKEFVEISIKETNVKSQKSDNIFIDTSVIEIFEETSPIEQQVVIKEDIKSAPLPESSEKHQPECENIFMDSCAAEDSQIDESFGDEAATHQVGDVEGTETAKDEITTVEDITNVESADNNEDHSVSDEYEEQTTKSSTNAEEKNDVIPSKNNDNNESNADIESVKDTLDNETAKDKVSIVEDVTNAESADNNEDHSVSDEYEEQTTKSSTHAEEKNDVIPSKNNDTNESNADIESVKDTLDKETAKDKVTIVEDVTNAESADNNEDHSVSDEREEQTIHIKEKDDVVPNENNDNNESNANVESVKDTLENETEANIENHEEKMENDEIQLNLSSDEKPEDVETTKKIIDNPEEIIPSNLIENVITYEQKSSKENVAIEEEIILSEELITEEESKNSLITEEEISIATSHDEIVLPGADKPEVHEQDNKSTAVEVAPPEDDNTELQNTLPSISTTSMEVSTAVDDENVEIILLPETTSKEDDNIVEKEVLMNTENTTIEPINSSIIETYESKSIGKLKQTEELQNTQPSMPTQNEEVSSVENEEEVQIKLLPESTSTEDDNIVEKEVLMSTENTTVESVTNSSTETNKSESVDKVKQNEKLLDTQSSMSTANEQVSPVENEEKLQITLLPETTSTEDDNIVEKEVPMNTEGTTIESVNNSLTETNESESIDKVKQNEEIQNTQSTMLPIENEEEVSSVENEEKIQIKLLPESISTGDDNIVAKEVIESEKSESNEKEKPFTAVPTFGIDSTEISVKDLLESSSLQSSEEHSDLFQRELDKNNVSKIPTETLSDDVPSSSLSVQVEKIKSSEDSIEVNESAKVICDIDNASSVAPVESQEKNVSTPEIISKETKSSEDFTPTQSAVQCSSEMIEESTDKIFVAAEVVKSYNFEVKIEDLETGESSKDVLEVHTTRSTTKSNRTEEQRIGKSKEDTDTVASTSSLSFEHEEIVKVEENKTNNKKVDIEHNEINVTKPIRSNRRKRTDSDSSQGSIQDGNTYNTRKDRRKIIKKPTELNLLEEDNEVEESLEKDTQSNHMKEVAKRTRKRTASDSSQGSVKDVETAIGTRRTRRKVQKVPVEVTVTEQEEQALEVIVMEQDEQELEVNVVTAAEYCPIASSEQFENQEEKPSFKQTTIEQENEEEQGTSKIMEDDACKLIDNAEQLPSDILVALETLEDDKNSSAIEELSTINTPIPEKSEEISNRSTDNVEMLPSDIQASSKIAEDEKKSSVVEDQISQNTVNVEPSEETVDKSPDKVEMLPSDIQASSEIAEDDTKSSVMKDQISQNTVNVEQSNETTGKSRDNVEMLSNDIPASAKSSEKQSLVLEEQSNSKENLASSESDDKQFSAIEQQFISNAGEQSVENLTDNGASSQEFKATAVLLEQKIEQKQVIATQNIAPIKANKGCKQESSNNILTEQHEEKLPAETLEQPNISEDIYKPSVSESNLSSVNTDNSKIRTRRGREKLQTVPTEKIHKKESESRSEVAVGYTNVQFVDIIDLTESESTATVQEILHDTKTAANSTLTSQSPDDVKFKEQAVKKTNRKLAATASSQVVIHDDDNASQSRRIRRRVHKSPIEERKREENLQKVYPTSANNEAAVDTEISSTIQKINLEQQEEKVVTVKDVKEKPIKRSRRKPTVSESSQGSIQADDNATHSRRIRRKVQKTPLETVVNEEKLTVTDHDTKSELPAELETAEASNEMKLPNKEENLVIIDAVITDEINEITTEKLVESDVLKTASPKPATIQEQSPVSEEQSIENEMIVNEEILMDKLENSKDNHSAAGEELNVVSAKRSRRRVLPFPEVLSSTRRKGLRKVQETSAETTIHDKDNLSVAHDNLPETSVLSEEPSTSRKNRRKQHEASVEETNMEIKASEVERIATDGSIDGQHLQKITVIEDKQIPKRIGRRARVNTPQIIESKDTVTREESVPEDNNELKYNSKVTPDESHKELPATKTSELASIVLVSGSEYGIKGIEKSEEVGISQEEDISTDHHNEQEHKKKSRPAKKNVKRTRTASETSQDVVVDKETIKRQIKHLEEINKKQEEIKVPIEKKLDVKTDKNSDNLDEIVARKDTEEKAQKSTRRRADMLSKVQITEANLQSEQSSDAHTAEEKTPGIKARRGRKKIEDDDPEPSTKRRGAIRNADLDQDDIGPSNKRRIGRRKLAAEEQKIDEGLIQTQNNSNETEESDNNRKETINQPKEHAISEEHKTEQQSTAFVDSQNEQIAKSDIVENVKDESEKSQSKNKSQRTGTGALSRRVRKASALDKEHHEHITAESNENDDTPARRARNVPQRKAATAYHNYDETSDSEIPTKTKKKTDSPRKSLEVTKSPPAVTITPAPVIISSPSLLASGPTTTARGRTRKPTARVQQFLEEERAKAETPKKRALLAAAVAVDSSTPQQRTPARRGRKPLNLNSETEATPQPAKSRGRGRPSANTPINKEENTKSDTTSVVEVSEEIGVHANTTAIAASAVVKAPRRVGRKAKLTEDDHHKEEEPPGKKSPVELKSDKSDLSPAMDPPTPTRTTGKRNAAAAAKARIEEDALAAAALDPPKRGRTKKINKIVATPTTTNESSSENKNLSQKGEERLNLSASMLGSDKDDAVVVEDNVEKDTLENPIHKRLARKIAVTPTTDSPVLPAKRGRKPKVVEEVNEPEPPSDDAKVVRSRSRRKVPQSTESSTSAQANIIATEPEPVETATEPVKRGTRSRRK